MTGVAQPARRCDDRVDEPGHAHLSDRIRGVTARDPGDIALDVAQRALPSCVPASGTSRAVASRSPEPERVVNRWNGACDLVFADHERNVEFR